MTLHSERRIYTHLDPPVYPKTEDTHTHTHTHTRTHARTHVYACMHTYTACLAAQFFPLCAHFESIIENFHRLSPENSFSFMLSLYLSISHICVFVFIIIVLRQVFIGVPGSTLTQTHTVWERWEHMQTRSTIAVYGGRKGRTRSRGHRPNHRESSDKIENCHGDTRIHFTFHEIFSMRLNAISFPDRKISLFPFLVSWHVWIDDFVNDGAQLRFCSFKGTTDL